MPWFSSHRPVLAGLLVVALCGLAPALSAAEDAVFRWVDHPEQGTADLSFGDAPVLRYMYAFKPTDSGPTPETTKVFHHVFGPGTDAIITKGAYGKYPHHRGLFVGWNKTQFEDQRLDFWHCRKGEHLRHARFVEMTGDAEGGTMTAEIHWNDREGEPVIVERRTVRVSRLDDVSDTGPAWQIDWKTVLESRRGEIVLDGDRQHAGFQFRADQPVADADGARYVRPSGFPQQPEAFQVNDKGNPPKHVDLGWLAMTYMLDGERYTIEYFEDPSLPKPSRYSERPYGRFGAFFKTTLEPDQPLTMRYRVIVSTGETPSQPAVQQRYEAFVNDLDASASSKGE